MFFIEFIKRAFERRQGSGRLRFWVAFWFSNFSLNNALPVQMPFLFFLTITSCIENQRERKKRAIALKREMPLNAHQSGYRIISLIIRIIIINKNEFSHFQSNNSKIKTNFFLPPPLFFFWKLNAMHLYNERCKRSPW